MGFLKRNITNICIILDYLSFIICSVMPIIYMDGCFRTIAIIQHNTRPFIVAFITVSVTIYLKIYNDVDNKNREDIKKFKEDFNKAYSDLQTKIEKFENDKNNKGFKKNALERLIERKFIETDLRYLMKEKIISKKCDFFSFCKNYILWKKQEKIYACNCILEDNKNLIQSCLDEIIAKKEYNNYNNCTALDYANLEGVKLININIANLNISIAGANFHDSNFLNSNINFITNGNCIFDYSIFNNTKVVFKCFIKKNQKGILYFQLPRINNIYASKTILIFDILTNLKCFSNDGDETISVLNDKDYDAVVNFFENFLKNTNMLATENNQTKFIFYSKYLANIPKLKEIETKHNKTNNHKVLFCSTNFPIENMWSLLFKRSAKDAINFLESNNLAI